MKIKKPAASAVAAPAETGGAAISDRFRLDAPAPKRTVGGKSTTAAFIAGLIALAVAGVLVYVMYQHWEFLMPA